MAGGFGIVLLGDKALARKLDRLGGTAARKIVRPAATKSMTPVVKAAKAFAPRETGLLAKSIGKKTKTFRRSGVIWTAVGPRKGFRRLVATPFGQQYRDPAKYAHLAEYGTKPHWQPKLNRWHPGTAAQPFLRRAWNSTLPGVKSTLTREIKRRLAREARRK